MNAACSIVHVITGLETGGAETMLLKLLSGADQREWRHSVVSLAGLGTVGPRIIDLGVPLTALEIRGSIPTPRAAWRLVREVRRLGPNLVQGWMYHGNLAATLAGGFARQRVPIVWNIRYAPDQLALEKRTTAAVIRMGAFLSGRPARIVYNSRAGAARHSELGYATGCEVVIPNGFDTERFAPSPDARAAWRRLLGLSESTALVGRIGRYHPMKDYATFLRAAALLVRDRPSVRFVMAGKGVDNSNADLTATITGLGLQAFVSLLGEITAVNEVTAALDVACSSSAYGEAFPNVLGEAMACGVPCVATDVGDSSWIVGEPAQVVPPGDPAALATALRALLDAGSTERERIGAKMRARVLREFSLPRIIERYESLYAEVLGNRVTT